ncbi:calcium binding protein CalD [Saccharothrix violaceirubra]|uniref:Ca2+-binding EF-hand superfamily protein n=1 Tax=Saccharothrix violaceirubra TaxID=413306 RepID=A0A7W7T4V8_9PSEU|nr:EF-hand domain-containing protein [Saccharothrix violaceirubra]MBB4966591.1 Ca2+-binding EF-hand superfamily protein [Saccharothrix violaceirubra]
MQFDKLDNDGSGYIELADYDRTAEALIKATGASVGSAAAQAVRAEYHKLFQRLADQLDTDRDGRISREEYFANIEDIYTTEGEYDILRPLSVAAFQMIDQDGDGRVSLQEFRAVGQAHGVPEAEYADLFDKHDTDGDGSLSLQEIHNFIEEYFASA